MRKGIFLSADIITGIVITAFAISLIIFRLGILSSPSHDTLKTVQASDILIVLHKSGVLGTQNATLIKNAIDLFVSGYYFSVQYYDTNLTNYMNITIGSVPSSYSFAQRPFYWQQGNKSIIGVEELMLS